MTNARTRLRALSAAAWVAAAPLASCTFQQMTPESDTANVCSEDADCSSGTCVMGMCVSEQVSPLALSLEVTPPRMLDGSEPQPALLGSFKVEGTTERGFAMPRPFTLQGRVTNGATPVSATLKFVRTDGLPKVSLKSPETTASLDPAGALEPGEFKVTLLEGASYEVQVTPQQSPLPPLTVSYAGDGDEPLHVDYGTVELREHRIAVDSVPDAVQLAARARSATTGAVISARVPVVDGEAALRLPADVEDYRLELLPESAYAEARVAAPSVSAASCDASAPAYPTLSIAAQALATEADGTLRVELPQVPTRIAFAGSIELCPGQQDEVQSLESLPITLRSSSLVIDDSALQASLSATTTASYDAASRTLRFCVEVFPGDYEIVVTPPSGVQCAIFAEQRTILAPAGMPDAATGSLLTLPDISYLSGTLQNGELSPLGGTSIEALALGVSEGIELEAGDVSVTRYNRSKQSTTDAEGKFTLPLDVGAYDVVFKPSASSGYGWLVVTDVRLARRDFTFDNRLTLDSPVLVQGVLRYSGGDADEQATLEGAEVRAFTVLGERSSLSGPRAVQVGKATANADGRFMLLITPTMPSGW